MTQAHSLSNAIASLEADVKRIREERDAALAEVQYAWQVGYDMDKEIDDMRAERDAARKAAAAWKRSAKLWRDASEGHPTARYYWVRP